MSRMRHIMIAALVTLAGAISCANEDKKLTIADQEAAIDSYISQNYANNTVVRRNGSNRVILDTTSVNIQDSLVYGDSLYFYYAGYVFTSSPSTLFSTNNQTVAEESGFTLSDPDYSVRKILFTKGCLVNGLENGMYGVKDGGHCIILFSAQYGFYDSYVYNIPKLSALAYEIWVDRVIKKD